MLNFAREYLKDGGEGVVREKQELAAIRARLEGGLVKMDRALLLRVMASFAVNFHGFNDGSENLWEISQQWQEHWIAYADPAWIDILADIIIAPPLQLRSGAASYDAGLASSFALLFRRLGLRFPDKMADTLIMLLSDNDTKYRVLEFLCDDEV